MVNSGMKKTPNLPHGGGGIEAEMHRRSVQMIYPSSLQAPTMIKGRGTKKIPAFEKGAESAPLHKRLEPHHYCGDPKLDSFSDSNEPQGIIPGTSDEPGVGVVPKTRSEK